MRVSDAEAFEMTRRLAGEEALLVGGSSGMAVVSAIKYALANDLDENQIVVVLAPDSGRSYLRRSSTTTGCVPTATATSWSAPASPPSPSSTLTELPLMRELGTDSITSYQKNQYQHPH